MPKFRSKKISVTIPEAYYKFLKKQAHARKDGNISRVVQDAVLNLMQEAELSKSKSTESTEAVS